MPHATFYLRLIAIAVVFFGVGVLAFWLADFVTNDEAARELIGQFGYLGVGVLAIIAGLNAVVPVPAATFTPVFVSAGLLLPLIVIALTLGTLIADLIGYYFGHWSRAVVAERYPKMLQRWHDLQHNHQNWLLPGVMIYAAIIPIPNEAILIPLAILGVRLPLLIPPLLIGNAFNQAALAYGFNELFMLGW